MTTELLKQAYAKALAYATQKYGSEPSTLTLESDGTFYAVWTEYSRCGDYETQSHYITAEEIN